MTQLRAQNVSQQWKWPTKLGKSGRCFPFIFYLSVTRSTQFTQVRAPITSCENSSPFTLPFGGGLRKSLRISLATMIKRLRACHRYVTTTSAPPRLYQECMGAEKLPPRREEGCPSSWAPSAPTTLGRCAAGAALLPLARAWEICGVGGPLESESDGKPGCFALQRAGKRNKTRASDGRQRKQTADGGAALFVLIDRAHEAVRIFQVRTKHGTPQTCMHIDYFSCWWDIVHVTNSGSHPPSQMSWSVEAKNWNVRWNISQVFIWNIPQIKNQLKNLWGGKAKIWSLDKTDINVFKCDKLWTPLKFWNAIRNAFHWRSLVLNGFDPLRFLVIKPEVTIHSPWDLNVIFS